MLSVDLRRITQKFDNVDEVSEVAEIFEVHINEFPHNPLKIKVLRGVSAEVPFLGIANYSIKNPDQAGPYRSINNCETIQKAVEDAISGFLTYFDTSRIEQTEFILDNDW